MLRKVICLLLSLGGVWWGLADGAVYRWVDENGRTQFGDRPPAGRSAEELQIKSRPTPGSDGTDAPANAEQRRELQQRMLDAYRDEREAKQQAREKKAAQEAKRKRACTQAKDQLRSFEAAGALYKLQPDGSRRYLSDQEYQAVLRKTRERVKQYCRSGG
ncbi:DUF4124 domain-containing protein [Sedimenticola thiotaurini]|uniref:DUF4124 domain-containing protein n=1 Tax=Sedimenticola thiotaurini TaxID=1543721 RepID=A0A0F7JZ31_9GAMM|nr:DUF4124 domain-containing protein [Sedimenticola thiotaurini]AKH20942.1 hypothetical protein AAY24_11950 [Sedimenticola thiotaurini]